MAKLRNYLRLPWPFLCAPLFLLLCTAAFAQDNYEIQVYGADTVPAHSTMVELHSNFTVDGSKTIHDGLLLTNHAEHKTLEITHGFNSWFETGFYNLYFRPLRQRLAIRR